MLPGRASAQSISDSCYIVPKGAGLLIQISKLDGQENVVGVLGTTLVQAIAFNPNADTLFAAQSGRMGIINTNTGAFTELSQDYGSGTGSLGEQDFIEVEGLTFDSNSNTLLGTVKVEDADDIMFKIDPKTGAHIQDAFGPGVDYVTISGPGVLPIVEDIAIDPTTSVMYGLSREDMGNDLLITIDPNNGNAQVIGLLGEDVIEGLGFDNEGNLFATPGAQSSPPPRFYQINLNTGAAATISELIYRDYESCDCLTTPYEQNTSPVAEDDFYDTEVNQELDINVPGVLENDTDADGDDLTIVSFDSTTTGGGTVLLDPDGSFVYTPQEEFEGEDTFTYEVSDGNGGTDTATVTIQVVKQENSAPLAADDQYSIDAGTELIIEAPGVLANDSDPDGDPLTVAGFDVTNTQGNVVVNTDGSLTYTPAIDSAGTDSFTYMVSDGNGNTDTAVVFININKVIPENNPPIAVDDEFTTDQDLEMEITDPEEGILANDSDPDGDLIAALEVNDGITDQGGRISVRSDGTLVYVPGLGYTGTDTYEYTICDDQDPSLCDSAIIYFEVKELPIVVFNAFSPNGDGVNDTWIIQGITRFPNNKVQVFNRWGNLIYQETGYDNTSKVWNGLSNQGIVFINNEAPDGAYYYIIELGDGSERLRGFVVLRR